MAVLALAVAGAYVGGTALAGGAIGAAVGWTAGSLIGNMLFPPKAPQPPLQDLHVQISSNGAYIPQLYGSIRTRLLITDGADEFTRHAGESGGKGGGSAPTPDTYSIDWFRGVICEGNGQHTIGRVWHTGRLVGDYRDGAENEGELPLVFYNGEATQEADPTEEAVFGAGMRSAFRNVASVVYTDLNLGETGNVLPNINVEVIQGAIEVDKPIEVALYNANSSGHQFPTSTSFGQPHPVIIEWPPVGSEESIRVHAANTSTSYTYDASTLGYIGSAGDGGDAEWGEDIQTGGDWIYKGIGFYNGTFLFIIADHRVDGLRYNYPASSLDRVPISSAPTAAGGGNFTGPDFLAGTSVPTTERVCGAVLTQDGTCMLLFTASVAATGACDKWYRIIDGVVDSTGAVNPTFDSFPGVAWGPRCGGGTNMGTIGGMLENDRVHCWIYAYNNRGVVCYWINPDTNDFEPAPQHLSSPTPLTVTANDGGPAAVYALEAGCKLGIIQGKAAYVVERCDRTDGFVRLYEIVDDQHVRSGSAEGTYDTSALVDIVRGFGVFAPPTGRSVIESMQDLYGFVPVDSPTGTRYVKLGGPSILTIPDEDLCAHDENGSEIPSPLQVVLGNDIELPCQIFLHYFDWNAHYEKGVQNWHRQHTRSTITRNIEAPIVLTAKEAKQMVDAIGERTLREADKYTFYLLRKAAYDDDDVLIPYPALEPADVVTVKGLDLRITSKTENMATGILKFEAVRSHPGAVIQIGAGGGDSEGIPTQEIPTPQETELVIGDLPWIEDETRQRVLQVAWQGALRRSWKGAQLNKSVDGGSNYSSLLTDNVPATIGDAINALPNFGGGYVFDEASYLDVEFRPGFGEFPTSGTRRGLFGGANFAMVGAEMVQYRDVEMLTATRARFRGFLRGRHGTQWAMRGHAVGDIFCLLPTPVTIDALTTDYGFTRQYKAVTLGRSLSTADAYPFRSNGVSLAPYAPHALACGFSKDSEGDPCLRMKWRRRTRFGRGWVNARAPTGQDSMPLGEDTEAYRVRIFEDGTFQTVVRTETVMDVREFEYTQAMQTEDFGSPLAVKPAWGVAQIGQLGPGYEMLSNGLGAALPLFIPEDSGGYVPPIPPPSEAIDDVMTWSEATTIQSGAFGPNDAWVIQFTTGSTDSGAGGLVRLQGAEFTGPPAPRQWTLSPIAGDFGPQAMPGAQGYGSPSVTALFVVGSGDDFGFYPTIPQSTTWYLNIRNQPSGYLDMPMFCTLLNVP